MLRQLYLKKEKLRGLMSSLWDKRENGVDWTADEKKEYEKHTEDVRKIDEDIKLRSEYVETFKASKDKEDLQFERNKNDASLFKIIKGELYKQTRDESYKDDYGRVNEVLQETRSKAKHIKDGFIPVPESSFEKRTDIVSSSASAGALISDVVKPELYAEGLYEKTWMSECGVTMLSGLEGDVSIPQVNAKPSFSWVAENSNFPEQDGTFKEVSLKPLYAGAIQVFSLGIFLRSQGQSVVRFIQEELMRSFRSGIEKSFIQDDGMDNKPKGVIALVPDANKISLGTNGAQITYAKLQEAEQRLVETNQSMPLKWLINHVVRIKAQSILKFAVNGASQLYDNGMLADLPAYVTNSVSSSLKQGSAAKSSTIVLMQPQSLVLGRWLGGIQLQINSMAGQYWKAGKTAVRVIDVCNMVSRRDSDLVSIVGILP